MQKIINLLFAGDVAKFVKDYLILIEIIFIPAISIILPAAVQTKVKKKFLVTILIHHHDLFYLGSLLWIRFNWFVNNKIKFNTNII
jgi:hypothetical protein